MKFLLTAINAKYIHSNPAVYSLEAYAKKKNPELEKYIEIAEYTINQPISFILSDIYHRKPDVIGFSCYIWNIEYVYSIIAELVKILPKVEIWLGGPEVSFDAEKVMAEHPQLKGIMAGEGEETFTEVLGKYAEVDENEKHKRYKKNNSEDVTDGKDRGDIFSNVAGIVWRRKDGQIEPLKPRGLTELSAIPFLYDELDKFKNKIIYYESGRGCPFECSYCLSSIDKAVRFRDIDIVKKELKYFLDNRVKQVKFVDRTFNCSHKHAMEIWKFIKENDNGVTNFHFEIAADILNEEELELVNSLRPGAIQMEIGVQSTNKKTIQEINRVMDVNKLRRVVECLHQGENVHIHLDLIAGLPFENYESFKKSFNDVFSMKPEQLQLGFLKVLKGSKIHKNAGKYGIAYSDKPPYEVLYTKWLSYDEILKLKQIEEMVELYYNSNQYENTLNIMLPEFDTPFCFFETLADFYEENSYFLQTPSRVYRYNVLLDFAEKYMSKKAELVKETLTVDFYLRENAKSRPSFARDENEDKDIMRQFWIKESEEHNYLKSEKYINQNGKTLARMSHMEKMYYDFKTGEKLNKPYYILFDYENRNPLNFAAKLYKVTSGE